MYNQKYFTYMRLEIKNYCHLLTVFITQSTLFATMFIEKFLSNALKDEVKKLIY